MLGKNNFKERLRKMENQDKHDRFSIRKLSIGAASVLIGFAFMIGLGAHTTLADELTPDSQQSAVVDTKNDDSQASTVKGNDEQSTNQEATNNQQNQNSDSSAQEQKGQATQVKAQSDQPKDVAKKNKSIQSEKSIAESTSQNDVNPNDQKPAKDVQQSVAQEKNVGKTTDQKISTQPHNTGVAKSTNADDSSKKGTVTVNIGDLLRGNAYKPSELGEQESVTPDATGRVHVD